jgi:hypothetical protein
LAGVPLEPGITILLNSNRAPTTCKGVYDIGYRKTSDTNVPNENLALDFKCGTKVGIYAAPFTLHHINGNTDLKYCWVVDAANNPEKAFVLCGETSENVKQCAKSVGDIFKIEGYKKISIHSMRTLQFTPISLDEPQSSVVSSTHD